MIQGNIEIGDVLIDPWHQLCYVDKFVRVCGRDIWAVIVKVHHPIYGRTKRIQIRSLQSVNNGWIRYGETPLPRERRRLEDQRLRHQLRIRKLADWFEKKLKDDQFNRTSIF